MKVEECDSNGPCEPNPQKWDDLIVGRFYRGCNSGTVYLCIKRRGDKEMLNLDSLVVFCGDGYSLEVTCLSIIPKSKSFKLTAE